MPGLVIRSAQLEVFARLGEPEFKKQIIEYLRSEYGIVLSSLSDAELLRRVEIAYDRARRFNFTRRASVVAYILLMFAVSPEFDTHPAIKEVLDQQWIPPDERMACLADAITAEEWEEARATNEGTSWEPGTVSAGGGH